MSDHKKRFNAQRAARTALKKPAAKEGVDFETFKTAKGWGYQLIGAKGSLGTYETSVGPWKKPRKKKGGATVTNIADARKAKEAKKAKPAKAEKPKNQEPKLRGKYKTIAAHAALGVVPEPPILSEKFKGYARQLRIVSSMVERADLDGLMAHKIAPTCSGPKMIIRYQNLAIHALKVRRAQGKLSEAISEAEWERGLIGTAVGFEAAKGADVRKFETAEQAIRASVSEMGGRSVVSAILPNERRLPIGRVLRGVFEPTEAAREIAAAA